MTLERRGVEASTWLSNILIGWATAYENRLGCQVCLADRIPCHVQRRRSPFQTIAQQAVFFLSLEVDKVEICWLPRWDTSKNHLGSGTIREKIQRRLAFSESFRATIFTLEIWSLRVLQWLVEQAFDVACSPACLQRSITEILATFLSVSWLSSLNLTHQQGIVQTSDKYCETWFQLGSIYSYTAHWNLSWKKPPCVCCHALLARHAIPLTAFPCSTPKAL